VKPPPVPAPLFYLYKALAGFERPDDVGQHRPDMRPKSYVRRVADPQPQDGRIIRTAVRRAAKSASFVMMTAPCASAYRQTS
jgi:hypothetical protein